MIDKKALAELMKGMGIKNTARVWQRVKAGAVQMEIDDLVIRVAQEEKETPKVVAMNEKSIDYTTFGKSIIERSAIEDMDAITRLPYVDAAALMPDAHRVKENHVPVGGVVLSKSAILPGVVGGDIACSVRYTATTQHAPRPYFADSVKAMDYVLRNFTYFGQEYNPGAIPELPEFIAIAGKDALAELIELLTYDESKSLVRALAGTARNHFGTSGDGNHFVEIGTSNLIPTTNEWRPFRNPVSLKDYPTLAILSHFGSRGVGAEIARFYLRKANELNPMPKGMEDNAPLYFGDDEWAEDYYALMEWAGRFTEASHEYVHKRVLYALADRGLYIPDLTQSIYTRHNYAWANDDGIVHRKGATPAHAGEYGVIPATMGDASRIVLGRGNEASLYSASHGAGRVMSRGVALKQIQGDTHEYVMKEYGVTLIGGDKDEDPRAYKRIDAVMSYQEANVDSIGEFTPMMVRMAEPRFNWHRKPSK